MPGTHVRKTLFWGAGALIGYAYVGFPVLIAARSAAIRRPVLRGPYTPSVTLVVAAYNEAASIIGKLENTTELDYPADRLRLLIASDGSTDDTVAHATAWLASTPGRTLTVQVLDLPRRGKNSTLNAAVAATESEIVVFTDADVTLGPDALALLMENFADPAVGCASGDHHWVSDDGAGGGERAYYRFERLQKTLQSRADTMTSSYGAVYAVRRELYTPLPAGVTDDFFVSANSHTEGHRIVFDPRALAHTAVAGTPSAEFRRKVRVIAAGLRGVWLSRHLLDARRYGFYSVQLFSHKVLRRLVAVPLALLAVVSPLLWRQGLLYRLATLAQAGLHGAALAGWLLRGREAGRSKLLTLPLYFDLVNVAVLRALVEVGRGARHDVWTPDRGESPTPSGVFTRDTGVK